MCIIIEAVYARVDLCGRCLRIVAAWYNVLKLNLTAARFQGNTVQIGVRRDSYPCKGNNNLQG